MTVAYLAHPLGERDLFEQFVQHNDNMNNAEDWFRFIIATTYWSVECSWKVYEAALSSTIYGGRKLVNTLELLSRCHVLLLTGGRCSPHMQYLVDNGNKPVLDLLDLGFRPPWERSEWARGEIARRFELLNVKESP